MSKDSAYEVILPTAPERAAKITAVAGARRHFWQRKRWLPTFDAEALLDLIERECPGDGLWIIPEPPHSIPGGAYMQIVDRLNGSRLYKVGLDMALSPHELSKALYHELEHCRQSRMFTTGSAFHAVANSAAIEGILSGLGSWYEERAQRAEDHAFDYYVRPLVGRRKERS